MDIHSWWGYNVLGIKEIELFNSLYYGIRVCGTGFMLQRNRMATRLVNKHTLMVKPMSPISVHCDSQSTLSRAYSQVYNGKSRHIGLRHRQVNQLINDGLKALHELKAWVLKHSEKQRYRPKANFNGSAQSGLNEREEGYA
ncbi:hypothetical protein Tco_1358671 [Tanacetum coccineum]